MMGGVAGYENTHGVAGELGDQTGTLSATLVIEYRIRYYLSSEKLKAVN